MQFVFNLFIIIIDQMMLFAINLIVARKVGEVLFGDYSVATRALLLLGTLITLGLDSIIVYYIPKYQIQKKYQEIGALIASIKSFIFPVYLGVLVSGCLFCLGLIGISTTIYNIKSFDIAHPTFFFLWGTVAISAYNIVMQLLRSINYIRLSVLLGLLQKILYFVFSLFIAFYLYAFFFQGESGYFPHIMLIGFLSSYLIVAILAGLAYHYSDLRKKAIPSKPHDSSWKEKIYGYTIQNLNTYVFSTVPLVCLEWLGSSQQATGLLSAVFSIIALAFIGIRPIGILIAPEISAAFAQGKQSLIQVMKEKLLVSMAIGTLITLLLGIFAPKILSLYKSNFIDALPYTYVSLINIILFSISLPLTRMVQNSHQGAAIGLRLTIFLMLGQIIACVVLIKWLGINGAVICYVGINVIYMLAMLWICMRILRSDNFN